jgi:biopolymer transport protein ExbD
MAGFSSNKPNAPITGINVTPLVDITLVLLIIFMVTAKLVVSRAVPMDLPKAATGGEVQQIFSVALQADQQLTVDGVALTDEQLLSTARAALAAQPDLRAVIDAAGNVPHSRVLSALDVLRQAGVTRVAFGVAPKQPLQVPTETSAAPQAPIPSQAPGVNAPASRAPAPAQAPASIAPAQAPATIRPAPARAPAIIAPAPSREPATIAPAPAPAGAPP